MYSDTDFFFGPVQKRLTSDNTSIANITIAQCIDIDFGRECREHIPLNF